ncbi:MAG: hypothetical protein DRJ33_06675 [Candidatus Methanomethylicota archaeon]|uniref:Uncharacterized protein n=1 Tax=Thermoproteota archaeon TaxID=2056631 RepID=A0A497EUS7_9CREN|nr:MAG: hypothetical protein DRJ33_06675 [Candidatus Verstraetearchaeota archaeon]
MEFKEFEELLGGGSTAYRLALADGNRRLKNLLKTLISNSDGRRRKIYERVLSTVEDYVKAVKSDYKLVLKRRKLFKAYVASTLSSSILAYLTHGMLFGFSPDSVVASLITFFIVGGVCSIYDDLMARRRPLFKYFLERVRY